MDWDASRDLVYEEDAPFKFELNQQGTILYVRQAPPATDAWKKGFDIPHRSYVSKNGHGYLDVDISVEPHFTALKIRVTDSQGKEHIYDVEAATAEVGSTHIVSTPDGTFSVTVKELAREPDGSLPLQNRRGMHFTYIWVGLSAREKISSETSRNFKN